MNPDKIIFASDDNPNYLNFWKLNSYYCKNILKITPVLFHITDVDSDFYEDECGLIKKVKKIENIPSSFQSQIIRMFGTQYFKNEVCVVSDIDLFLIDKSYVDFENNCDILITDSDAYDRNRIEVVSYIPENLPRYPICYTIGLGYTFQKLLNLTPDFNEYCNRLYNLNYTDKWSTDEFYFGKVIEENNDNFTIKKKQRGYMSNFFITDRINKCNFSDKSLWKIDLDGQINFKFFKDIHFPKFTQCDDLIHRVYKNLIKFKTNEC